MNLEYYLEKQLEQCQIENNYYFYEVTELKFEVANLKSEIEILTDYILYLRSQLNDKKTF